MRPIMKNLLLALSAAALCLLCLSFAARTDYKPDIILYRTAAVTAPDLGPDCICVAAWVEDEHGGFSFCACPMPTLGTIVPGYPWQ